MRTQQSYSYTFKRIVSLVISVAIYTVSNLAIADSMVQSVKESSIKIESPWVRLLPPTVKTTAGYMSIQTTTSDVLLSASSLLADRVELHLSEMKDGMMSMNQVSEVAIKEGEVTRLSPGGYHLMIIGLKESLSQDKPFPLELNFEKAGTIKIDAKVESP